VGEASSSDDCSTAAVGRTTADAADACAATTTGLESQAVEDRLSLQLTEIAAIEVEQARALEALSQLQLRLARFAPTAGDAEMAVSDLNSAVGPATGTVLRAAKRKAAEAAHALETNRRRKIRPLTSFFSRRSASGVMSRT
jgi:hypothetical protein